MIMIYKFEELKHLFKEIEMALESPVSLFVIGGAALLHYGLGKGYTKDIDVIVMQNEHFESFRNALNSLKFQSRKKPITHFQLETYEIMECKEFRFDIFLNKVCGDFAITDSMIKRSSVVF